MKKHTKSTDFYWESQDEKDRRFKEYVKNCSEKINPLEGLVGLPVKNFPTNSTRNSYKSAEESNKNLKIKKFKL